LASLNNKQTIAGVLLASGASKRLKAHKQLVPWGNSYLINHIIGEILKSYISDLHVILGCEFDAISQVIDPRPKIVQNRDWFKGKSSSIFIGVEAVESYADGIIFFLVDQPFINASIINKLVEVSENSKGNIISTRVNAIQTTPVLFKRKYYKKLKGLSGEEGGKSIINNADDIEWIEWEDEKLLMDIDTEEDLQKVRNIYLSSLSGNN